jgi:hypothetical protein
MATHVRYFTQASAWGSTPENELGILKHGCDATEATLAHQLGEMTETDV